MRANRGYTVVELMVGIVVVGAFAMGALLVYVAAHFVLKFW